MSFYKMRQPQKFRELLCVVWCLLCVAAASLPSADPEGSHHSPSTAAPSSPSPVMQSSYPSQEFLTRFTQVSSPNSEDPKHRDASDALPFIGLTSRAEQSRSCCKNGGTCILGSFCACTPFFTGRSCEYDTRKSQCDFIPHGEFVQKGCSYCRCFYGILHCFPHMFHKDCDDSDEEVRWYHSSAVRMLPLSCFQYLLLLLPVLLVLCYALPESETQQPPPGTRFLLV